MSGRSRHTPAERAQLLAAWASSDLSAAAFASSCGVSKHTLYSWRRDTGATATSPSARATAAAFAEVRLRGADDGSAGADDRVEIRVGDMSIAVGRVFDDDVLARIIRVVREAS